MGINVKERCVSIMKIVLYSQRVEIIGSYGERRDCADQNIPYFIKTCGYLPLPLPNNWNVVEQIIKQLQPSGIVLTGGNSLVKYGGNAPERDDMEKRILDLALACNIPVYGFCRGMQVIVDYFGCELVEVQGHVAVYHKISGVMGTLEVNSFHNQACYRVKKPLEVLAQADDGVIEAICYKEKHIIGTMWHPERESPFKDRDIQRMQELFG